VSLSAVVMGHPDRRSRVLDLADQLGAEVVWDRHHDVVETCLRALQAYDPATTHHLVLQDDSIVCRDLLAGLAKACQVAGERPVSPYLGTYGSRMDLIGRAAAKASQLGAPWVEAPGPRWGVAHAHPTRLLPKVIDLYRQINSTCDDARLNAVYGKLGIACWYTMPSLVEHDDDLPSLTKRGWSGHHRRVAFRFLGADASALDVDWSGPIIRK
jgi:hypothetical protein